MAISGASNSSSGSSAAVSLLFAGGCRPTALAVRELAEKDHTFAVSFDPSDRAQRGGAPDEQVEPGWIELLDSGLTFDLVGLAPGVPAADPPHRRGVGLNLDSSETLEAVTLIPGPHLSRVEGITPIVRMLALLGAKLAGLDGTRAIAWHAAGCWSEPNIYRDAVTRWADGGVFPGLTLASLVRSPDGGMHSEGLALFTGQEVRLDMSLVGEPVSAAKLAVRVMDMLVDRGRIDTRETITGPDGERLRLEPAEDGHTLRVRGE